MSSGPDFVEVILMGLMPANAMAAGISFAEGDMIGGIFSIVVAAGVGAYLLWSWMKDSRKEKEWYQRDMEIMNDRVDRFQDLSDTLVGVLDVDPVPVELEARDNDEVEIIDLREQGDSAGMA